MTVKRRVFSGAGTRISYQLMGAGSQAIVCLHGFPQTGRLWERLARRLPDIYVVIAPDLRGAGDTQRPSTGYDKKTMAADVHGLVASLGYGRVRLVGHDIGAAVAYAYAAQWPADVAQLVLIEMLLPGFGLEELYAVRRPGEFAHMPFFMAPDVPEWLIAGREAPFLEWFIRNMVADQSTFSAQDIADYARDYSRPGALCAAFDTYRAFWRDADDNRVFARTKLAMPVLAIGAALSVGGALAKSLQPLTESLRGLVFADCGHSSLTSNRIGSRTNWKPSSRTRRSRQIVRPTFRDQGSQTLMAWRTLQCSVIPIFRR